MLRPEVELSVPASGPAALEAPWARIRVGTPAAGLVAALRLLLARGACEDALADVVAERDGATGLAPLYYCLARCREHRLLGYAAELAGERIVTVVPMAPNALGAVPDVEPATRLRLSRFSCARRDGAGLVVETPLAGLQVHLHGGVGGAVLAALARPIDAAGVTAAVPGATLEESLMMLRVLNAAGVIALLDEDGALAEDREPTMRTWEFHDLLFHSRSRLGRHDHPYGGTYRFLDELPPLPAVKARRSATVVHLQRPAAERLEQADPPFTAVLEGRCSRRAPSAQPITIDELGDFLYRAARVRSVIPAAADRPYEASSRPYPSGGATYDLELYLTVSSCRGLEPGLYHYDPLDHGLVLVTEPNDHTRALLDDARWSAGLQVDPQVLITAASRFGRLSWKYASMAYATTLKNVGVLLQTMYLVATAMGLSPCALGGGNSDAFAAAAGTDYYAETSVGELMLGGPSPADSPAAQRC